MQVAAEVADAGAIPYGLSQYETLLSGNTLDVFKRNPRDLTVNNVAVVQDPFNVASSSGIVHSIDRVLVPGSEASLYDYVRTNSFFSTLLAAVHAADLQETLSDPTATFTLWAPDDGAYWDESLLEPENQDLLRDTLLYHVTPREVVTDDLAVGQEYETAFGATIEVTGTSAGGDFVLNNNALVKDVHFPGSSLSASDQRLWRLGVEIESCRTIRDRAETSKAPRTIYAVATASTRRHALGPTECCTPCRKC